MNCLKWRTNCSGQQSQPCQCFKPFIPLSSILCIFWAKAFTTTRTFLPSLFNLKCPSFSTLSDGITSHLKVYLRWSPFHEASPDLTAFELSVVTYLMLSSATRGCLIRCLLVSCQIALSKQELYQMLFTSRQGLCHGKSLLAVAELKQWDGCLSSDEKMQRENQIKRT